MALFKIFKGNSANLPTTLVDGYCYFTTDDGMFYIDYEDTDGVIKRKPISGPGRSIEYIVGTLTAKTGSWKGITKDSNLVIGKTIAYKLPYAGDGNASLTLDYTNPIGSTTLSAAIPVYTNTSRVTTHYGAGAVILLTYDGTNWRATDYWNSNSRDPGYGKITPGTASNAVTAITPNTTLIVATTYNEAMTIEPGNKWIQLAGTDGAAGTDTITIGHAISGATAGNYGDSANQTPSYNGTFKVPYLSIDAGGHITSASEHTVKIPTTAGYANSATTASRAGTAGYAITAGYAVTASNAITAGKTDYALQLANGRSYDGHENITLLTNDLTPVEHKVYESTAYYATSSSSWETSTWYFMSVKPDAWYKPWTVRFKVHTFEPSYSYADSISYCTISGRESGFVYANWNERYDTAHYYTTIYPLKKAGFDAGYGHAIGISILNGHNYTNSVFYRTFEVDYFDCDNCTVTLLDTPVKWASWTGTGTTNYGSLSSMNAVDRGLQESGDANSYNLLEMSSNYLINGSTLRSPPYTIFGLDRNGNAQAISLYSAGYTSSTTNLNTARVYNTTGIDWTRGLLYANTGSNFNISATISIAIRIALSGIDFRYTDNCVPASSATTLGMVSNKPVYFRGVIKEDGLFYLAPISVTYNNNTYLRAWTLDIPTAVETDGTYLYVYWFIGYPYYSSSYAGSLYLINLYVENNIYWYHNGRFEEYGANGGLADTAITANYAVTAGYATTASRAGTAGYAVTASNATTAGYATTAARTSTAGYATTAANATLAGKLSTTGTTGQFWRGDNTWSNKLTDKLIVEKGLVSFSTTAENISGYFKFATLVVSGTYVNRGILISYSTRGRTGGIIYCIFNNTNSTDPTLTVTKTGTAEVYYIKSATSTWDLYMSKSENYDLLIFSIINSGELYNSNVVLTWSSTSITELPAGYSTAAIHTLKMNIDGSAATLTTSRTLWGLSFNGSANISGSLSNVGNITPAANASYSIGTSSNKFTYVYATTFTGALAGNAATSTTATNATKVTQNVTNTNNIDYRLLLSGTATNAAEVNSLNKSSNLIFNPSLNKLSTVNLDLTGNLNITGNAYLNNETYAHDITTNTLLVQGNAAFAQIPTSPTPEDSSNDTSIATTAFVKKAFAANDAMVFKGVLNASSEIPASGYSAGWTYRIGTAGSYAGEACEVGDLLIAINDGPASGSSLIALDWIRIEHNIDGALFKGTNAFTNNHVLIADSTNGKVKDSGYTIAANVGAGQTNYLAIYTNGTTIGKTLNAHINTTSASGSVKGYEELVLGDTSTRFGRLALYGSASASGGAYIVASNPTSWTNHVLPNTAGWLVTAGNGSSTGAGAQNLPVYIATTGVATAVNAQNTANNLLDNLSAGSSDPLDGDTYIASYADGKNTAHNGTNTYHRRPISNLYNYIKTKLAVTNNNINLSWNTETTIATIGGTAIKVKIPANPNTNTDTLVKQTAKTDNVEYKLLATASASPTSGAAAEATYNVDITINPSKKSITASTYNVTSAASITYNTSTGCLEIIT